MTFQIFDVAAPNGRPFRAILPIEGTNRFDPFLVFHEQGPIVYAPGAAIGFREHSHRGIETITYVVDGEQVHRDSHGNEYTIAAGGVQWMRAGSGISHSELPTPHMERNGGPMHAFQIWLELPFSEKRAKPRYQEAEAGRLPIATGRGWWARVIAGSHAGFTSPIGVRAGTTIAHVRAEPRADVAFPLEQGATTLVYAMRGSAILSGETIRANQLAVNRAIRRHVAIGAGPEGLEALLLSALPVTA